MKRITVDEVLAAYKATGLVPRRGTISVVRGRCCAIGALAESAGITRCTRDKVDWFKSMYGHDYCDGFVKGFDGHSAGSYPQVPGWRGSEGYADGVAAAAAVFGEAAQ